MRGRRCNKQHFNAESTFYNYSWRARISQIFLPLREFFSNAQGIMHTWLIFSGCIPTRSMSTLYIRDISVNKSKQSVCMDQAGQYTRPLQCWCWCDSYEWCPPAPVLPVLCRAAPLSACPPHLMQCRSGQRCTQLWPALLQQHSTRSIHCPVESKLDERNVMDILINTFWYGS